MNINVKVVLHFIRSWCFCGCLCMDIRGQLVKVCSLLPPWVLGLELRSSGFHSKCLHWLSRLLGPYYTFIYFVLLHVCLGMGARMALCA